MQRPPHSIWKDFDSIDFYTKKWSVSLSDILYKYYSINNNNLLAVSNNQFWLSHPSKFNDPFDSRFRMTSAKDKEVLEAISKLLINMFSTYSGDYSEIFSYKSLLYNWGSWNEENNRQQVPAFTDSIYYALETILIDRNTFLSDLRNILKQNIESEITTFISILESLGICCFSRSPHDPKMWAHYADNHKGFCVEYKVKNLPTNSSLSQIEVEYNPPNLNYSSNSAISISELIKCKTKSWEHEKEVRIISKTQSDCLISFSAKPLKICFGNRIDYNDKKVAMRLFEKIINQNKEIIYCRAQLNMKHYMIDWKSEGIGGDMLYSK